MSKKARHSFKLKCDTKEDTSSSSTEDTFSTPPTQQLELEEPHCSYKQYRSTSSPSPPPSPTLACDQSSDNSRGFDDDFCLNPKKIRKRKRHTYSDDESQSSENSNISSSTTYPAHDYLVGGSKYSTRSTQTVESAICVPPRIRYNFKKSSAGWKVMKIEKEEKPSFRPVVSPLELPYLLNMIFDYLPLKDLKNCRQVNSTWRSASLAQQIPKYKINIKSAFRLRSVAWCPLNDVWGGQSTPAIFTNVEIPNDVSLKNNLIVQFFQKYGKHIKSLVIPNNGWTVVDLQEVLFKQLPVLEELKLIGDVPTDNEARLIDDLDPSIKLFKLKRLYLHFTNAQEKALPVVHLQGFFNSGTNPWTKRLISDLLFVSPNLEIVRCSNKRDMLNNPALCVKIGNQVNRKPEEIAQSFSRVNQFLAQKLFSRQHDSTPKLVNLDLYLRLNDRGMQKLEMKNYPLQSLDLHVRFLDKQNLISLLKSLGKTLTFLRLRMDRLLMIDFPCDFLEKLETFHLEEYAGLLTFLGELPKLTKLTLDRFECKRFTRKYCVPSLTDSKVHTLILEGLKPLEKQGKCIKRLAILLPNIKNFTLNHARDSDLLRIFDSMPQLEHLRLISESITSTALSGHTDADTELILDNGYELSHFQEHESRRRLPYIGDLKNLQTLALEGDLSKLTPHCMTSRMISHMHGLWVLHGICNLKHLRRLVIHNTTMSSLELKQIVKKMDLIKFELQNCKIDTSMEKWIKKKMFGKPFEFILRKKEEVEVHPPLGFI